MLCDVKISDMARIAAFLKRLVSVMLCCGSSEAMVLLGTVLRWEASPMPRRALCSPPHPRDISV